MFQRQAQAPSSIPLPRLERHERTKKAGAGSLPISENSFGYGTKLANHKPAWLTMTTVDTTAARLVLFSPPRSRKARAISNMALAKLVPSIVRTSPNIFCTISSFNVYIPQLLQPVADDSGHLPRARSPWMDSKSRICFSSNYSRQWSQAESIGLVRAILKALRTTRLRMARY
jgi:hypothetical protein